MQHPARRAGDKSLNPPCARIRGVCEQQGSGHGASLGVCEVHASIHVGQQLVAQGEGLLGCRCNIRPAVVLVGAGVVAEVVAAEGVKRACRRPPVWVYIARQARRQESTSSKVSESAQLPGCVPLALPQKSPLQCCLDEALVWSWLLPGASRLPRRPLPLPAANRVPAAFCHRRRSCCCCCLHCRLNPDAPDTQVLQLVRGQLCSRVVDQLVQEAADVSTNHGHAPHVGVEDACDAPVQILPVCGVIASPVGRPLAGTRECGPARMAAQQDRQKPAEASAADACPSSG